MYFVYCLYMCDIPFYVGMTNNPIERYKRHYYWNDCLTYNFIRYKAVNENKMMEMKVVFCSPDKQLVLGMEYIGIKELARNGFVSYNQTKLDYIPTQSEGRIIYPHIEKFPHYILTQDALQHVLDNTLNILIEYGYEEFGHKYMDYAKSISRPIRNKRAARSQLGTKTQNRMDKITRIKNNLSK